ncbi:MAG: alpha/beta hydrolase-fold protein [Thermoanaerobaculia bacterium]
MRHETRLRVHYPMEAGALVLRSETDWDADIEPVAEDRTAGWFDFDLAFDSEFLYFKPVMIDATGLHWAKGDNDLALPGTGSRAELWPYFLEDSTCSVCNVHEVGMNRTHDVRVFYPPGYAENPLASYPVMYMQDGQNLFFPNEAFGGQHWKVEETLGVLSSMNLIRKSIVVGIYPRDRMHDYTKPGYETYGDWLVGELKPWVEARYRTLPGPENSAVMGSSLGGVVSFYLGWQYPEQFGRVGAMSSTFGYRDDLIARVASEPRRPLKLYLDTGWPRDNYEVNRSLRQLLLRRGYVEGVDLLYLAFPDAAHNERSWAMRAHVPFQFFFGGTQSAQALALGSGGTGKADLS